MKMFIIVFFVVVKNWGINRLNVDYIVVIRIELVDF